MGDFNRDEYNEGQLHWIDIGLKEQHDILKYIDPFYTAEKMRDARLKLVEKKKHPQIKRTEEILKHQKNKIR